MAARRFFLGAAGRRLADPGGDGGGQGQGAFGLGDMQVFDQFPIDRRHSLTSVKGGAMGSDNAFGPGHRLGIGAEMGIGGSDSFGMDQGFTIKAKLDTLPALSGEARVIVQIQVFAIQNR